MITAVDTNVMLDILIPDERFGESSKMLLDRHLSEGKLILCEVVYAELAAYFPSEAELKMFLAETGMRLVYSNETSLYVAGTRWATYAKKGNKNQFTCSKCGTVFEAVCPQCKTKTTKRLHVLADFLIGAHALIHADRMFSRDLGVYTTYFSDLKVVSSM
jgi:predicted nucleic acid-binding protein